MSISPLNFNGMIQSTSEAVNSRTHEDAKPQIEQAAVTLEISKRDEASAHRVNNPEDSNRKDSNYDREGNGRGYNRTAKKMLKKKSDSKDGDGKVIVKPTSSFDIKI